MMSHPLIRLQRYLDWWLTTLRACAPQRARAIIERYQRQDELLILHEGDSILVKDSRGQLIDSMSYACPEQAHAHAASAMQDTGAFTHETIQGYPAESGYANDITLQTLDDRDNAHAPNDSIDVRSVTSEAGESSREHRLHVDAGASEQTSFYVNDHGRLRALESNMPGPASSAVEDGEKDKAETVSDAYIQFQHVSVVARRYTSKNRCVYLLPGNRFLQRRLTYPTQALEDLETVLYYDLEKHVPLGIDEIRYFYSVSPNPGDDRVEVDVAVMKKTDFLALKSALGHLKGYATVCTTADFYRTHGRKMDFLARDRVSGALASFTFKRLQIALNTLLLAFILMTPYYHYLETKRQIAVASEPDMARVKNLVSTVNGINDDLKLGSRIASEINQHVRMVSLLRLLSESIHTDAWITRFSYKNRELTIKGEAVSATSVLDSLNASGRFESIKFISSIIKNPSTRKEAFELLIKVKQGA
jgi:hypothetical protein